MGAAILKTANAAPPNTADLLPAAVPLRNSNWQRTVSRQSGEIGCYKFRLCGLTHPKDLDKFFEVILYDLWYKYTMKVGEIRT